MSSAKDFWKKLRNSSFFEPWLGQNTIIKGDNPKVEYFDVMEDQPPFELGVTVEVIPDKLDFVVKSIVAAKEGTAAPWEAHGTGIVYLPKPHGRPQIISTPNEKNNVSSLVRYGTSTGKTANKLVRLFYLHPAGKPVCKFIVDNVVAK